MTALRRLSVLSLLLGIGQVVFGAIVRITGSGMGCGDHWPKCHGYWFPPLDRPDLVIEVTHRYIAATLSVAIIALLVTALRERSSPGWAAGWRAASRGAGDVAGSGRGAVRRRDREARAREQVRHRHASRHRDDVTRRARLRGDARRRARRVQRERAAPHRRRRGVAPGGARPRVRRAASSARSPRTCRARTSACLGFPLCRGSLLPDGTQHIQFTHRVLAFLLFFHMLGLAIACSSSRRSTVDRSRRCASRSVPCSLQLIVAAMLVEMQLPPLLRSLHQAAGTLVWVAVVVFALLAVAVHSVSGPATKTSPRPTLRRGRGRDVTTHDDRTRLVRRASSATWSR